MREAHVLSRCDWPVMSVPMIAAGSLTAIADELVRAGSDRRGRRRAITDLSAGGTILAADLVIARF